MEEGKVAAAGERGTAILATIGKHCTNFKWTYGKAMSKSAIASRANVSKLLTSKVCFSEGEHFWANCVWSLLWPTKRNSIQSNNESQSARHARTKTSLCSFFLVLLRTKPSFALFSPNFWTFSATHRGTPLWSICQTNELDQCNFKRSASQVNPTKYHFL